MDRDERDAEIARQREAAGERWHRVPRDGAWREVTLTRSLAEHAVMWVHCACGKSEFPTAAEFVSRTGADPQTPLLTLAMRMRCTKCRTKRVTVSHRPYSFSWD